MKTAKKLNKVRVRRVARNRAKIFGTAERPRLSVSRSNRFFYAQLIDDAKSHTIAHASAREAMKGAEKKSKTEASKLLGALIAKKAAALGVKAAVFDRGSYRYHGRVKAFAEGAREGGLKI
ncbi:MAG TPA: 50S ribosomal protein L18 [Candidatus Paceibacterota bacterium]|nr:50S ribosomal protein L18 [Candidatus Paceibacterota bacterium]